MQILIYSEFKITQSVRRVIRHVTYLSGLAALVDLKVLFGLGIQGCLLHLSDHHCLCLPLNQWDLWVQLVLHFPGHQVVLVLQVVPEVQYVL